jgi:hypothetical protein
LFSKFEGTFLGEELCSEEDTRDESLRSDYIGDVEAFEATLKCIPVTLYGITRPRDDYPKRVSPSKYPIQLIVIESLLYQIFQ